MHLRIILFFFLSRALLIWGALTASVFAVSHQPKITHLSTEHGLSQTTVNAITQDARGYIWLGTSDGLNRYNGYEVKVYKKQQSSDSISDDNIKSLRRDKYNRLWVGTKAGLNLYHPKSDSFSLITGTQKLSIVSIHTIYDDLLLTSRNSGIFILNTRTLKLSSLIAPEQFSLYVKPGGIRFRTAKQDAKGNIWVASYQGLFIFNPKQQALTQVPISIHPIRYSNLANDIAFTQYNQAPAALVATSLGLYLLDLNGEQIKAFFYDKNKSTGPADNLINAILIDDGHVWLATHNGLSRLSLANFQFTHFRHHEANPNSLADNALLSLFKDNQNTLWLGSFRGGADRLSRSALNFGLYRMDSNRPKCLSNHMLYNILLSSKSILWLGASRKGLHSIKWPDGPCTWYQANPQNPNSISSNHISPTSLLEDRLGRIWFGANRSALNLLDPNTGKVKHHFPSSATSQEKKGHIATGAVRKIVETPNGDLWFATKSTMGGLSKLDSKTQRFTNYGPGFTPGISSSNNYDLVLDENFLWIATETAGLDRFEMTTQKVTNFGRKAFGDNGTPEKIFTLIDDGKGHLWLGTQGEGLVRFNKTDYSSRYYTTAQGLANNTIYAIERDKQGNLWLATNKGLSKFNPNTESVENYEIGDGLQGKEFNVGSHYSQHKDLLFFVGSKGLHAFKPGNIQSDTYAPAPIIEDFTLFNHRVPGLFSPGDKRIELEQSQNVIGFTFATLNFVDPSRHQYQYKLDGFDKDWRPTPPSQRSANYTNLDAGKYQFRVKASNHRGVWSKETSVSLIIHPPLWLTWWAKLSYLVFILLMTLAMYRYRTAKLRTANIKLEHKVARRTQELKAEKDKVEALLRDKTREFDNISHEFRTPLTVILGRAQDRLATSHNQLDRNAFSAIQKVAQRLALVVDDVIEMGRASSAAQAAELTRVDLSLLCHDVCSHLKEYAALKRQRFHLYIDKNIYLLGQPRALEKMLNNLVGNAIKYTHEEGEVALSLRTSASNIKLQIKDNGPGIAKVNQQKIFERFYRSPDVAHQSGSGIGLALVKEVVKAHQGEIQLISEVGKGCEFMVQFPLSQTDIEEFNTPISSEGETKPIPPCPEIAPQKSQDTQTIQLTQQDKNDKPSLLLVEDNPELSALLIDQLGNDYDITAADNGLKGLNLAQLDVPDIVLSDINMPYMDGYQLLNGLKNHSATSHIPVILLTAKVDAASRIRGYEHAADGYLAKPYLLDELKAMLRAQHTNRLQLREYLHQHKPSSERVNDTLPVLDPYSNRAIQACRALLEARFSDPEFSIQELTEVAHLSERQLARKFQNILGVSLLDFITEYRLAKAKSFLQLGYRVGDVATRTGFNSANYFSRQYKKKYGLSPSAEIKARQRDQAKAEVEKAV